MARVAVTCMCCMKSLRLAILLLLPASARIGFADLSAVYSQFFDQDSEHTVESVHADIRQVIADIEELAYTPPQKPLPAGVHCPAERNELVGTCHGDRDSCFCKPLHDRASLHVLTDLTYSDKHSLLLDLYMPPLGAGRTRRPAIVQVHGGDMNGMKEATTQRNLCSHFATHGYICAAIEYRSLNHCCGYIATTHAGTRDVKAAIRWLRRHADTLDLDASRIAGVGTSLGATMLMGTMMIDDEGDSGNEGYSSQLRIVVAMSGAFPFKQIRFSSDAATRPRPPYINFHACGDLVVPYSRGSNYLGAPPVWDATTTHDALRRAGVDAHFWSIKIEQHIPWQSMMGNDTDAHATMLGMLKEHLGLDDAQCSPTRGASTAEEREAISRKNARLAAMRVSTEVETVSAWRAVAARSLFPDTHAAVALGPGSGDSASYECLLNHARASGAPPPPEAFSYDHSLVVTCCDFVGRPSNPGCAKRMQFFEAVQHCDSVFLRLCAIGELAAASPEPTWCDFSGRRTWVLDPCASTADGRLAPAEPHFTTRPRWTGGA